MIGTLKAISDVLRMACVLFGLSVVTACGDTFQLLEKRWRNSTSQPPFVSQPLDNRVLWIFPFFPWSDLHWSWGASRHWGCLADWKQCALIRLGWALLNGKRHLHISEAASRMNLKCLDGTGETITVVCQGRVCKKRVHENEGRKSKMWHLWKWSLHPFAAGLQSTQGFIFNIFSKSFALALKRDSH